MLVLHSLCGSDDINMTFYFSLCLRLKVNRLAVIYQLLPPLDIREPGSPMAARDSWCRPPALPAPKPWVWDVWAREAAVTVGLGDDSSLRAETKT